MTPDRKAFPSRVTFKKYQTGIYFWNSSPSASILMAPATRLKIMSGAECSKSAAKRAIYYILLIYYICGFNAQIQCPPPGHLLLFLAEGMQLVLTSADSSAEEDNDSDHRPLSVKNEGKVPMASTAAEREDDDTILWSNQDQLFKKLSLTNFPKRGDLLQPPIMGLAHPLPKMNIPVMDQHHRWLMNKPAQLFDTYY
uniref:Uncharacterized protein n=1 Tax=Romanomermis culicivorax TaxID=13658 RepID=A0A915KB85_ROMCU